MIKHRWPDEIKEKAVKLRTDGFSYTQITKSLGVVKSTLNTWLRDLPKPEKYQYLTQDSWLKTIRPLAQAANKRKNDGLFNEMVKKVKTEVSLLEPGKQTEKSILSMLYWAEGSKRKQSVVIFANTDPRLIFLFATLLRRNFQLDESKFRVRLHLHYYHRESEVKKFWSKLLKIPENRFGKTYRKKRSKEKTFRRNFGGICFLKYNSVYLQREIMQYAFAIAEKIAGKIEIPPVPVA